MAKDEIKFKEAEFIPIDNLQDDFDASQKIKRNSSSAPTHSPKNWYEQMYLYKDGATYRLYINIDNTWKYINLS